MPITLVEQHQLSHDGLFVNKVRQALSTIALEVMKEDPTGMVSGEYDSRLSLARRVINSPQDMAQRLVYTLATASPTTDPDAFTDEQYLGFIRLNWNALSGFNPLNPVV